MNLKVSVWSDLFWDKQPEEQVLLFKSKGFDVMELSVETGTMLLSRGNVAVTGKAFKQYMDDNGFSAPQGHLKLECDICKDEPQPLIDELKQWIELYATMGVKNMVFHSGGFNHSLTKEELLTRRLFAFNQLLPIIEGTDNYLCLENLVTIIPHSEELVETIEATNSKNVGICFDCGHLNIGNQWSYQETQQHFFDVCGKYIRALHVADNDGRTDQHLIPVAIDNCDMRKNYTTKVDIYELVRLLKSINYQGLFNFEVPGEAHCPLELRLKKLEWMKMLGEYFLSSVN